MRLPCAFAALLVCGHAAALPQSLWTKLNPVPPAPPKVVPVTPPKVVAPPVQDGTTLPPDLPLVPPPIQSVPRILGVEAPALNLNAFNTPKFARPLSLQEAASGENASVTTIHNNVAMIKEMMPELQLPPQRALPVTARELDEKLEQFEKRQTTCASPRVRIEWDRYTTADRQAFINGVKCLMTRRPGGQFSRAQNRYEDLIVLHQSLTPTIHGNAKFLLWHRYYLWTFEDLLRRECGFTRPLPWFDEARYAGRFAQSSLFSNSWFGSMMLRGSCVIDGQFANLALNIGPGTNNVRHCLSRNGDESKTYNTNQFIVDACNARIDYANMAACAEGAAHAWGHNGIGAVMQDVYASPGDPLFWLHHAYVDRNFAKWQNANARVRTTSVRGSDAAGRAITLNTVLGVGNIRPDVRIGDIINTNQTLCYRYDY